MNKKRILKRKFLATLIFSLIASAVLIVHGVFFDLNLEEIKRITIGGFLLTSLLTIVGLTILEKIFDLENHAEIIDIKKRLKKLERK